MKHLNSIYQFVFSLFFASIPITEHIQAIPNILMGILVVLFPFVLRKDEWKSVNRNLIFLFLILGFVVLAGLLVNKRWEDFPFLSKIFVVPLVYVLSVPVKNYRQTLYFFLFSSLGLLLTSAFKMGSYYLQHRTLNLDVGSEVNQLLMGERPYIGVIYLISLCLSLYLMRFHKNKIIKLSLMGLAVFFCAFILFVSARLSILSLLIITGVSVFYIENKKKALFFSSLGMVVLLIAGVFNPNFISRLTAGFKQDSFNLQQTIAMEPRSHIWECSMKIGKIDSVPLFGYGFRTTIEKLTECYSAKDGFLNEEHRTYFLESRFNTHNQFLGFYLSSGLLSLLVFLILFFVLFKLNFRQQLNFSLVLIIFLFCVFENVFSRQLGVMLVGVVLSVLGWLNQKEEIQV